MLDIVTESSPRPSILAIIRRSLSVFSRVIVKRGAPILDDMVYVLFRERFYYKVSDLRFDT